MPCWVLRDARLVAVVGDVTTALKLLPQGLNDGWALQLVDVPAATPIDSIAALLRVIKETSSFSSNESATLTREQHL
jgi:hypothetical protein